MFELPQISIIFIVVSIMCIVPLVNPEYVRD